MTSTRSEGGLGRRRKAQGSAVQRTTRPEEEEEEGEGEEWGPVKGKEAAGGMKFKRKEATPPGLAKRVSSVETGDIEPQELSSEEEEGEEEEEGAAPSVVESSVVVLEEVITPRRECAFPRAVKRSMNAVAPITCLMKLAEMQNPPPMVQVPEYLSPERYFTQDYLVALDDLQEEGVNARLDLSPLELLNPPKGKERDMFHSKGEGRGRLEAIPDLVPLPGCMKELVKLATRPMPAGGLSDGTRRAPLMHLEVEIRDAIGVAALR